MRLKEMFDQMEYREGLKAAAFVSDSQAGANAKAEAWLDKIKVDRPLHLAGMMNTKTGKDIYVMTIIYAEAG